MITPVRAIKRIKKKVANFIATNSSYHFLVRDWAEVSDMEVAVKLLGTEFFRNQLKPIELPLYEGQRILVIAPHQDDESIGAGGTLAKASKMGAKIKILFATDGSQNNIGYSIDESINIRNNEALKVCELIGADYEVLPVSNFRPKLNIDHIKELNKQVYDFRPDVVLVPWILDAPVKHRMVNHLLALSNELTKLPKTEIWGYQVHNTLYPNGYVDITNIIDKKHKMVGYYKSQNHNIQCYDHLSLGMSAWNSRFMPITKSNGIVDKKYAEVFFTLPSEDYFSLINQFYEKDMPNTYKGDQLIINEVTKLISELRK